MGIEILSHIPEEMTLGETVKFKKTLGDFPFSEGWILTYYFVKQDGSTGELFDVEATQSGSSEDYLITIATANTSGLEAGDYSWRAKVTLSGETSVVEEGSITLNPSYESVVDTRSDACKIVAAIDASMAGKATPEQKKLKIKDREVEKYDTGQLMQMRTYYSTICQREKTAELLAQGKANPNKTRTRLLNN